MKIKEEAIKSIPYLSDEELKLFHQFLFDLIMHVNYEFSWVRTNKPKKRDKKNERKR